MEKTIKNIHKVADEMKEKGYHVDDESLVRYIDENYLLIRREEVYVKKDKSKNG